MTVLAPPTLAPPPPPGPYRDPGRAALAGRAWRWVRLPLLIVVLVIAAASVVLIVDLSSSAEGTLNPHSYRPDGGNALRVLTERYGTPVETPADSATALRAAQAGDMTVLIPDTTPLTLRTIRSLRTLPASSRVVLLAPSRSDLAELVPGVSSGDYPTDVPVPPACTAPEASAAGSVDLQRAGYSTAAVHASSVTTCYQGGLLLVRYPTGPEIVVLSDDYPLMNGQLAQNANAALAINLLSTTSKVEWLYLDQPESAGPNGSGSGDPEALFPAWVSVGFLYLVVAGVLVALWQSRRLGTPVPEPLPVVVRSAETVEGRARLYRRAGARQLATESLRGGALARITPALGLGPDPDPRALILALSQRSDRTTHEIHRLLYSPPPTDDKALVALATDLDRLVDDFLTHLTIGRAGGEQDRNNTEGLPQ
jgi:hypothetical protein